MTIKQVPDDLKRFWAAEAKRHDRSMNTEVLHVMEQERTRREAAKAPSKDIDSIKAAARRLQSFALVDQRAIEEILYDEEGMPK